MSQQEKVRDFDFSRRLREAREILGITQDSLGKMWEVEGNYIYILESGKRGFPKKWQTKVLDLEEEVRKKFVSRNQPLFPQGSMALKTQIREGEGGNLLSISDTAKTMGEGITGEVRTEPRGLYIPARRVPVVGFAAGANMLSNQGFNYEDLANQIEEEIATDSKDPNALGLIVEGDSMDPEYQAGDRIVVAPNAEPRNRDVVVARLREEGSALLKRFYRTGTEGRTIKLVSTNPNYAPIEKDITEFRFIYVVVDMRRVRR